MLQNILKSLFLRELRLFSNFRAKNQSLTIANCAIFASNYVWIFTPNIINLQLQIELFLDETFLVIFEIFSQRMVWLRGYGRENPHDSHLFFLVVLSRLLLGNSWWWWSVLRLGKSALPSYAIRWCNWLMGKLLSLKTLFVCKCCSTEQVDGAALPFKRRWWNQFRLQ